MVSLLFSTNSSNCRFSVSIFLSFFGAGLYFLPLHGRLLSSLLLRRFKPSLVLRKSVFSPATLFSKRFCLKNAAGSRFATKIFTFFEFPSPRPLKPPSRPSFIPSFLHPFLHSFPSSTLPSSIPFLPPFLSFRSPSSIQVPAFSQIFTGT